ASCARATASGSESASSVNILDTMGGSPFGSASSRTAAATTSHGPKPRWYPLPPPGGAAADPCREGAAMTPHPLAGKPAPKDVLIDPAALERAYYELAPDPADPRQRVGFGTSGHRG